MIRGILVWIVMLGFGMVCCGCTDIVEPNQLAFVLGTSVDLADNGEIEISHQIVIPPRLKGPIKGAASESNEGFIVVSATGKTVFDAIQKIQLKSSRKLMTSHRILIAISEEFVEGSDISLLFDKLNRDPSNNLRDVIVLVKGGTAREFLMLKHPMEQISSIAAARGLEVNGMKNLSSRQFIIDSLNHGTRPILPVISFGKIQVDAKKREPIAIYDGYALLNRELKVKGILGDEESCRMVWMTGKGVEQGITIIWKSEEADLSFRLTHLQRHLSVKSPSDPTQIVMTVKAQAYLMENTANLDMFDMATLSNVQKQLNKQLEVEMKQTIEKVQEWGTDVFGIGELLHRKYPRWWRTQQEGWDDQFKHITVTVKADLMIRAIGTSGSEVK
jgi:spore germination protein KC